jgi:quercetin dioxygenase-like cupin family protein
MAYKGKIISNSKTGQQIRFLQTTKDTDGKLLEMESLFQPLSKEPVPHYHPFQEEDFTVLEGEITVRLKNETKILRKDDHLHIKANEVHSMWNHSSNTARVNWKVAPALDTEYFLEAAFGIGNGKKTNAEGMPGILHVALLAKKFAHVFRIARPSYRVQKIIFGAISPISYMAGYRSNYQEFID